MYEGIITAHMVTLISQSRLQHVTWNNGIWSSISISLHDADTEIDRKLKCMNVNFLKAFIPGNRSLTSAL